MTSGKSRSLLILDCSLRPLRTPWLITHYEQQESISLWSKRAEFGRLGVRHSLDFLVGGSELQIRFVLQVILNPRPGADATSGTRSSSAEAPTSTPCSEKAPTVECNHSPLTTPSWDWSDASVRVYPPMGSTTTPSLQNCRTVKYHYSHSCEE